MRPLRAFFVRFAAVFRRREADLSAEMESLIQLHAHENRRAGMSPEQAQREARLKLGGVDSVKEAYRDRRGLPWLEHLFQDLRYALRQMRHSPGFTAVAVLSLALGIGANTAIFSFTDAILLRSLPVRDPESLVIFTWHSKQDPPIVRHFSGEAHTDPVIGFTSGNFPYPFFTSVQANPALDDVFAFADGGRFNVLASGESDLAFGTYVSGTFFRTLGVSPTAGRPIEESDDTSGATPIAVLSSRFAKRHFGEEANAIGKTVLVNNRPVVVTGVAPPSFWGVNPQTESDILLPLHSPILGPGGDPSNPTNRFTDPAFYWVQIMGRLKQGVSAAQTEAALGPRLGPVLEGGAKEDGDLRDLPALLLQPGGRGLDFLRRQYGDPLRILTIMVALLLAISCANIANLLLARASARRREIAVRMGIGAGRGRIARQLLTESLLLAGMGGALSIAVALWGMRSLTSLLGNGRVNFTLRAELNWHVMLATFALAAITGILFGLAPALEAGRVAINPLLKESAAGIKKRVSLSHMLVAGQIATSVLLLGAAALFVHNLENLQNIALGFNRNQVLLLNLNAGQAGYRGPALAQFYADLRERFLAIPGVSGVTLSDFALVSGSRSLFNMTIQGSPDSSRHQANVIMIGPAFFHTMQIPILAGREIDEHDTLDSPRVAIVNREFVRKYFPAGNALGSVIEANDQKWTIAGICENARYNSVKDDIQPTAYFAYGQGVYSLGGVAYEFRTSGDPLNYASTVRRLVREANPRIPVTNVRTQSAQIDQTLSQERTFAILCTCFAILALVIASVGLYGTMAYTVARRTGEIGIRMALGAQRPRVIRMVLGEVGLLAAVGLGIGVPVSLAVSKFAATFLFQLKPADPWSITAAVAILLASAALAGYLPAYRASRIDPLKALRHD